MSAVDFGVLDLLPKMLEKIESMENEIIELKQQLKPKYDLTKRAGVMKYLNISNSTLNKYMKEGTLREGYHFYRQMKQSKSIITFVSGAIEEFKKEKNK